MTLSPIPENALEARLKPHLAPDETVLWQGGADARPPSEVLSFVAAGGLIIAGVGLAAGMGALLFPALALASGSSLVPGLVLIAVGGVLFYTVWFERAANWFYAMTDQRILLIRGGKLYRTGEPAEMANLNIAGQTVYWRRETRGENGKNVRLIGFKGMRDPTAAKQRIEDWCDEMTARRAENAARFTEAVSEGDDAADVVRVVHPGTGLQLDVPSDWQISVGVDREGPLKVLGVTLLKRVIRRGPERPYGTTTSWNTLRVRAGVDAGLYMIIKDTPLAQSFEEVVNDPWNERLGLEILQATPEIHIGDFEGFSMARRLPSGGPVQGFGPVTGEVLTRMVWLGNATQSIEFIGLARADQPDVQKAVDAMVQSLSQQ